MGGIGVRFVQIRRDVVVNIIEAEPKIAEAIGALPYYEGCCIGQLYVLPLPEPDENERLRADLDYLAALQGVTL